jgi:hypothetical protein
MITGWKALSELLAEVNAILMFGNRGYYTGVVEVGTDSV